ncbi:hypothetical protein [Francisella tularensis]|nr:hypothetical protein [Francisella tularensis]
MAVLIDYDEEQSLHIIAVSDGMIVPSRFDTCGLNLMNGIT